METLTEFEEKRFIKIGGSKKAATNIMDLMPTTDIPSPPTTPQANSLANSPIPSIEELPKNISAAQETLINSPPSPITQPPQQYNTELDKKIKAGLTAEQLTDDEREQLKNMYFGSQVHSSRVQASSPKQTNTSTHESSQAPNYDMLYTQLQAHRQELSAEQDRLYIKVNEISTQNIQKLNEMIILIKQITNIDNAIEKINKINKTSHNIDNQIITVLQEQNSKGSSKVMRFKIKYNL